MGFNLGFKGLKVKYTSVSEEVIDLSTVHVRDNIHIYVYTRRHVLQD